MTQVTALPLMSHLSTRHKSYRHQQCHICQHDTSHCFTTNVTFVNMTQVTPSHDVGVQTTLATQVLKGSTLR